MKVKYTIKQWIYEPKNKMFIFSIAIFSVLLAVIFFLNPYSFGSSYKTQEILYRSKKDRNVRIEFQMQNIGSFGYNERVIKIHPGIFWDFTQEIDPDKIDTSDWIRVHEDVNELNLKYP